tara:strand:- start:7773 stop:9113 length:1341 start_codon:yes stop_codon:yes gene_type:complete
MTQQFPSVQEIYDLQRDMKDAEKIVNGDADTIVQTRLGGEKPSLARAITQAVLQYGATNSRGAWQTGVSYQRNDIWQTGTTWYLVLSDYTSGATAQDDIDNESVYVYAGGVVQSDLTALTDMLETAIASVRDESLSTTPGNSVSPPNSLPYLLKRYIGYREIESLPATNDGQAVLVDTVREEIYLPVSTGFAQVPKTIRSRLFFVCTRGYMLRFTSAYTGTIKARVYPIDDTSVFLPGAPVLANNQWHEISASVASLYKFGWDDNAGDGFQGIIDWVRLENTSDGKEKWVELSSNQSSLPSIGAIVDYQFGSQTQTRFQQFDLRSDGYWYGEDITPAAAYSAGASWEQVAGELLTYTATAATDETDALQLFASNTYDLYETELIVVTSNLTNSMAATIDNAEPNIMHYDGPHKFIIDKERIYFKRAGGAVSGTFTIESAKLRLPND